MESPEQALQDSRVLIHLLETERPEALSGLVGRALAQEHNLAEKKNLAPALELLSACEDACRRWTVPGAVESLSIKVSILGMRSVVLFGSGKSDEATKSFLSAIRTVIDAEVVPPAQKVQLLVHLEETLGVLGIDRDFGYLVNTSYAAPGFDGRIGTNSNANRWAWHLRVGHLMKLFLQHHQK